MVKDLGTPRANGRRHRSASADKEDTAAAKKVAKEEKAEIKRLMQSRDKLQEQEIKRIKKRHDKELNAAIEDAKRSKLEKDAAVVASEKWKTMHEELKASTTAANKLTQKELTDSKNLCKKLMQDIAKLEKAAKQPQSSVVSKKHSTSTSSSQQQDNSIAIDDSIETALRKALGGLSQPSVMQQTGALCLYPCSEMTVTVLRLCCFVSTLNSAGGSHWRQDRRGSAQSTGWTVAAVKCSPIIYATR